MRRSSGPMGLGLVGWLREKSLRSFPTRCLALRY